MTKKSIINSEIDSIVKISKYQLPHYFKRIGFTVFLLAFVSMFVIAFTSNNFELKQISKYFILLGLLLVSISKEEIEDERIIELRMQSFTAAFIIGVVYALAMPVVDYAVDAIFQPEGNQMNGMGDFVILWMLLFVQVFFFHMLKIKAQC